MATADPSSRLASPLSNGAEVTDRYRYERKFFITELARPEVELMLRLNPAMFLEIYHPRYVNNIYLDSWCRSGCADNLDGRSGDRCKTRIRWYGDLEGRIERPVLEFKIKHGEVNRKQQYPLDAFEMDNGVCISELREIFRRAQLPKNLEQDLLKLEPALVNRYRRNYFLTAHGQLRATIDSHLQFGVISASGACSSTQFSDPRVIVLEVKYGTSVADFVDHVTQHFPFRLSRSSKYVMGVERLRLS